MGSYVEFQLLFETMIVMLPEELCLYLIHFCCYCFVIRWAKKPKITRRNESYCFPQNFDFFLSSPFHMYSIWLSHTALWSPRKKGPAYAC